MHFAGSSIKPQGDSCEVCLVHGNEVMSDVEGVGIQSDLLRCFDYFNARRSLDHISK